MKWYRLKNLINKDLKRFMRDKATILLLFLQPIIIMVLTGIVFQEGVKNVPIAICLENSTNFMENLENDLVSNSHFYVKKFVASEDEAKELIDKGVVQGAIILKGYEVKVIMDGSKPMYFFALTKLVYDATEEAMQENMRKSFSKIENIERKIPEIKADLHSKFPSFRSLINYKSYEFNNYDINSFFDSITFTNNLFEARKVFDNLELQERNIPKMVGSNLELSNNLASISQVIYLKSLTYSDPQLSYISNVLSLMSQKFKEASPKMLYSYLNNYNVPNPNLDINTENIYNFHQFNFPIFQIFSKIYSLKFNLGDLSIVPFNFEVLYNGDKLRFLDLLAPIIIAVSVAFSALLLTAPTIVEEKQKGTLERLSTTPVHKLEIVAGKIISSFIFVFAQGLFMILIGILLFKLHLTGSIWLLSLFLGFIIATHLGLGAMISAASKTDREALQAVLIIMLLSIILSGMLIPIEMLPPYIRPISYLLPLTYAHNMILGVMVKGAPLNYFAKDLIVLTLFSILALIGGAFAMLKGGEIV